MNHHAINDTPKYGNKQRIFTTFVNENIKDRLNQILNGRKKHPWGEKLGFTRGTLTRLFNGEILSADKLLPICRAENVSLSWLLDGVGEPYQVHHTFTDEETADLLSLYIDDEDWEILVLKNQAYPAIVLTLPATMMVGKKHIDYTATEIIAGPMDYQTLSVLNNTSRMISEISSGDFNMRKLYAGKMSNLALLGNEKQFSLEGLAPFNNKLIEKDGIAERYTSYNVDTDLIKIAIEKTEDVCIEQSIKLNAEQKSRIISAIYKHMQRTHSKIITQDVLITLLDSL